MATELVDRPAVANDEHACQCGYVYPKAISFCPRCSRPTPGVVATYQLPNASRRVRGIRLAFGVIILNIVWQVVAAVAVLGGHMEPHKAAGILLWSGVGFYAVVMMVIAGPLMLLKPAWLKGDRQTAAVLGIEVGLAAAVLIILFWVSSGHPMLDPSVRVLVSEGSITRTILAFVVIAMIAPVVEELLFRGVVAESLRKNAAPVALGVSSFLFALAHLHSLRYYTLCGLVLGLLYWHRGLWASIAAHATFNGALVVLAVVVALGPPRAVSNGGVSLLARTDWQVSAYAENKLGATLAMSGPSGSAFIVTRHSEPVGAIPNLDRLASLLNDGAVPMPAGYSLKPSSAQVIEYPTGRGVQVGVVAHGHEGVVVVIPRPGTLWEVDVATGGSARAQREYPAILHSLSLPEN